MTRGKSLWIAAPVALVVALLATLLVRAVGLALVDVPPEFPPLDGPAPTIFFTVVGSVGAVAVYALVRRTSSRPDAHFRLIAVVALLLSFLPDLWLMSAAGARVLPGATVGGVAILMAMHVAAAVSIVWALTTGEPLRELAPGE